MNPNWRSFLEAADACFADDSNDVLHFGYADDELAAAQSQTILAPLTHLSLLGVEGEDARSFLHSQLTNDINHLTPGKAQHAAWCTAKGRMQASFIGWAEGEAFRLALSADLEEATRKRLQMFILRSRVKLTVETGQTLLIGLAGPQMAEALAEAALSLPDAPMTTAKTEDVTVLRLDATRSLIALPEARMAGLWQALSGKARPVGLPVWRWLDIQAGLPWVTLATKEDFVPQMADFEKLGGVSFHKGCYPGQEIVARTQYLGKVKRHLYRLKSDIPVMPGADLHSPANTEQAAGKIVSVAPSPKGGFEALAVVQALCADDLHLESAAGPKLEAVAVNP